jgi:CheY-like chemotaxis protein
MSSEHLLAEVFNRTKLLDHALAHVEAATAMGGRPAQRDALKALYHTVQLFAADAAQLRARAETAGILTTSGGYNDEWLVVPDDEEHDAMAADAPAALASEPVRERESGASRPKPPALGKLGGTEKILVVDPDEGTRALATGMLRELGYRVHETRTGEEALAHLAGNPDEVHLLITAQHLPGMTGSQLAESVSSWHPHARALFTQADAPLRPSELAGKVREALAAASGAAFSAA